jgi:hypothetical protein
MSEESSVVVAPDVPQFIPDYRLIARNPAELEASRLQLKHFFDAKIDALQKERSDLDANLSIAMKFPIRTQPITAQINRVQKRIDYYTKARAAVEAGFTSSRISMLTCSRFAARSQRPDIRT